MNPAIHEYKIQTKITPTGMILILMSAWFFGFYLLPNTVFSKFSLISYLPTDHVPLLNVLLLLFLTAAAWFLLRPEKYLTKESPASRLWVVTGIYLALFGLTALLAALNKSQLETNCFFVLLALMIGLLASRLCGNADKTLLILGLLALIQAVIAIVYVNKGINVLWSGMVARAGGTFNQPNLLYFLMICILPYALVRITRAKNTLTLAASCCSFAILFSALLLTWMRGGMIAASASLIFVIHSGLKNRKITLAVAFVAILFNVLIGYWRNFDPIDQVSTEGSNRGRAAILRESASIFVHHFWSGMGLGATSIPLETTHAAQPGLVEYGMAIEPKNLLLHWADELGIGGVILFFVFVYLIYKTLSPFHDDTSIALSGAWIAILAAGMFDTPFGIADRACGNALVGALLGATIMHRTQIITPVENAALIVAETSGHA